MPVKTLAALSPSGRCILAHSDGRPDGEESERHWVEHGGVAAGEGGSEHGSRTHTRVVIKDGGKIIINGLPGIGYPLPWIEGLFGISWA